MRLFGPDRTRLCEADLEILACPSCRGELRFEGRLGSRFHDRGRTFEHGAFTCRGCGRAWPVDYGLVWLYDRRAVEGSDLRLRRIYDWIAPTHEAGVHLVLPSLQYPDPGASRERYIEQLRLSELQPSGDGPVRILEVGVGAGGNLAPLREHVGSHLNVEIWGVDLSVGMLLQCWVRAGLSKVWPRVPLLLADAHHLPFRDRIFDRVFHVGGINGYRDKRKALADMARVARPDTPIVVVDEELDRTRTHGWHHRLSFKALTWFDDDPRAPADLVPVGARNVRVRPVSRFYYCLSFEAASPNPPPAAASPSGQPNARGKKTGGWGTTAEGEAKKGPANKKKAKKKVAKKKAKKKAKKRTKKKEKKAARNKKAPTEAMKS